MCHTLCSNPYLEGEELLEDCIRVVESLDHVILMDDFENGVRTLFEKLGRPLIKPIPHKNPTTEKEASQQTITDELIEKIKEREALDIRLYEYCKKRFL